MNPRWYWHLFIFIIISTNSYAQTDTEFWFVAPEVSKNGSQNFDIPIYLRVTTFDNAATVTISEPANAGFVPIVTTIPANGFTTVDLSTFLDNIENKPANAVLNYGLHIVSTSPVSIYYEVASTYCNCNPELYTLKGKNALGSNFLIATQNFFYNSNNYSPMPYNAFDIVATTDNTTVTITPSKSIVGHAQGIPFSIVLNKGQTYSAVATSQLAADHLFGSEVISDKPIAITMSDDLLFGITGCADLIGDQIVPVNIIGTKYIAVKGNLTNGGNRAFILATQNNTQVFIDGNPVPVSILNTGQLFNNEIVNSSAYIETDKPVYVFQTSGFGCELGGALLPPIFCTGSTRVVFTRTTNMQLGLVITTLNGDQGNFLVNGDPTMITAANFLPVPGTGGTWVSASLTLSLTQIPVGAIASITNSTGRFHLGLMIGNPTVGGSYGYYSDFSRLNLGPDQSMCNGSTTVLDAGSGWASYLWNNGATTQSIPVSAPGTYWVTASDPGCTLTDTAMISLYPDVAVSLGPDTSICDGQSVTFDAGLCTGCTYQWGNLTTSQPTVGTSPTYTTGTAGTYMVTVTRQNGCQGRDTVQLMVNPPVVPGLSIAASVDPVCDGIPVTYTAIPVNQGSAPAYQWKVNAMNATNATSSVFTYAPANGDKISCTLLSSLITCISNNPAASDTITMVVNPNLPVSISVSGSANPVCDGTPVTFTATPLNGGMAPAYQWKVNTINATNATNSVFTYTPVSGDLVSCILTSSEHCTTGNPASCIPYPISILPLLPVSVTVAPSQNPVCAGSPITFTATPVNGGTSPGYQWKVNASNAGNASNATFSYNPVSGDLVSCILTSSETCTSGNPASCIPFPVSVLPLLPVSVAIDASANPFCPGTPVTFTATPVNGGTSPGYQWKVNASNANNATNAVYTYNPVSNDLVSCILTSDLACVTSNPATSPSITMSEMAAPNVSFTSCFDTVTYVNAQPIRLKGGLPPGGTYSGPGVNSITGIFTPSSAGAGLKTITYSYSNVYTCMSSTTKTILVKPAPSFTCGSTFTDPRDNKAYPTVQIGTQCWMSSNLDFGFTIDDLTPQADNCLAERYLHTSTFGVQYSIFYQWDELMQYTTTEGAKGLCPPGWHIPTSAEWDVLVTFNLGPGLAAGPIKDPYLVNGFHSYQDGFYYLNNTWAFTSGLYSGSMYWTSTPAGTDRSVARGLNDFTPSVSRYEAAKGNGFSARCLRD
jgi:uncharacterized protein (TIGR02145 family)